MLNELPEDVLLHIASFGAWCRRRLRPTCTSLHRLLRDYSVEEFYEVILYAKQLLRRIETTDNEFIGLRAAFTKRMFAALVCQKRVIDTFSPCFFESCVVSSLRKLRRSGYFSVATVYLGLIDGRVGKLRAFEEAILCIS